MAYSLAYELSTDQAFSSRVRSCMYEQALTYQTNADPAQANLARDVLRGSSAAVQSMIAMIASFPGMTDEPVSITKGDGSVMVDQSAIDDETILSQVQTNWQTLANLFNASPMGSI